MKLPTIDTRRESILASAWEVFAAYGFRRTSMQDIAEKVGISRPALYLEFSNKTDIFRGLAQSLFDQNIVDVEGIFKSEKPLQDKLLQALNISYADFQRDIENTPHGEEILNLKAELAGDIYLDWLKNVKSVISDGLKMASNDGHINLEKSGNGAEEIAAIIINTMNGSKSLQTTELELRQSAENVVSLIMAALSQKS